MSSVGSGGYNQVSHGHKRGLVQMLGEWKREIFDFHEWGKLEKMLCKRKSSSWVSKNG